MTKLSSEKYTILLIILIFIIPLIALDSSFYIITRIINFNSAKKEQEKEAIHEAESLAIEGNFSNEFSIHFKDFFDTLQKTAKIDNVTDNFLKNHLETASNKIFEVPFPQTNLYVFRIPFNSNQAELFYYNGSIKSGKRVLCKTFEHLYTLNRIKENEETNETKESKQRESLAKKLLGKYTDINAIGQEMRGITTNTNGIHRNSWFIWDYAKIKEKDTFGVFLICDEINNYAKYGRLLALKKLKSRGKAIGAFIPIYKEYGEAVIQPPLDKSNEFNKWIKELTINDEKYIYKWLRESLPQGVPLGKYSAFCHLGRGDSHIAVVLVKSLNINIFPKWLISINLILIFILLIITYNGLVFGKWPNISLKARFIISYALASVIPLSLLSVTAYGYLHQYERNSIELANKELQKSLKEFDSLKLSIIKDYKTAFTKLIKNPNLIKLIKEKGIKSDIVTKTAVEIFENKDSDNYLPILGIKIYDEIGEGTLATGTAPTFLDINSIFGSFDSTMVNMLIDEIKKEGIKYNFRKYKPNEENELANNAYKTLANRDLKTDIYRLNSIPIPRKNGNFCNYFIFDTIKIDKNQKYMLFAIWDDKTLDEITIKNAFNNKAFKKLKQNFIAYIIKGEKADIVGEKTRHVSQDFIDITSELAKQASHFKKTENYVDNNNIIVVMPSLNFNQTIFIGWIDKIDIIYDLFKRKITFIILIIISLFTLWICSLRSYSVFLKPISSLKNALDEVSFGNLKIGFNNTPDNELGNLSNEFDKMIGELREKERLTKLISDQAVQALKKNSSGLLNDTETFNGVALVSDIRNFTGMSEKYDPSIITELLNEHFAEMSKIISDNGGQIYKFIGDAIEAVFPEKENLEKTAIERAFQSGCQMIIKLKAINNRRTKLELFPYRIGVGLCYGTMHSGTVGSLETRLDYSILGTPLKNAAKYEALTIQNPDFPITLDEKIAEKLASLGLGFKSIDTKGQNFKVYTLDQIGITTNDSSSFIKERKANKEDNKKEDNKIFSLSNYSTSSKYKNNILFYAFLVIFLSLLITYVAKLLYDTTYDDLKSESDKEVIRLNEQLNCNDVLKSCFEYVCFDFYEDLNDAIKSNDDAESLKEIIEQIDKKYTNKGYPIPYYCCCLLDQKNINNNNKVISKGFSPEACNLFYNYAKEFKRTRNEKILEKHLRAIMGPACTLYSLRSVFYKRSSQTSILNKEMLLDTNIIFDKEEKKSKAYIFCGMPQKDNNYLFPKYYTVLAGKQFFMAIKDKENWSFSEDFPENEKQIIINNKNDNYLKNKGYYIKSIEINNETYIVYSITKDLFFHYKPSWILLFIFALSLSLLTLLFIFMEKSKIIFNKSISGILRKDIILSALIPILTVTLVSHLYIEEEFNAKKSDLILNLNKLMNEVENKEFYYLPLCENIFKNLPKNSKIQEIINNIKNSDNKTRENNCRNLSKFLKNNFIGNKYKDFNNYQNYPYFIFKEVSIIGKDGWISSVTDNNQAETSVFGQLISKAIKTVYFEANSNGQKVSQNVEGTEGEIIAEKLMKTLSSGYGSDLSIRIINLPNNLIILSNSYSSIGIYLSPVPNVNNPEYIIISLIFFECEILPDICSHKNQTIPYKKHLESGSLDDELYCFYSPNINVGTFFDFGYWYEMTKDEFKTIKELGLASSWINTSYLPVSKKVDLNGLHFLETKQGNIIKDNVYAALASEFPLHKRVLENIKSFASIILFSIIMIFLIAYSITSDLLDPVKKLINGAGAASKGNYKFRTNFSRKDELGTLCDSFDKMMKGLEEKQLMNRMVSKTALKVASDISDIESKKVDVALLYVTVPNFDKIMKNLPPFELFSKLREQIAIISEIVIENGGDIDKIMGEKLLIAFHLGDKTPQEVAANASKAASLIENCDKLYFKVSVGVNFGEVISGYLGVGEKRDFTIIGDPVNVTARIAVFAEKLDNCLISETIYKYISNNISAKLYGEVELKGKSKPMKVYQLI